MAEKQTDKNSNFSWIIVLVLLVTGAFTLMNFYEYYKVAFKKDIQNYPFGAEGPVAGMGHYKTPELYAEHALNLGLVAGALFLALLFVVILRRRRKLV